MRTLRCGTCGWFNIYTQATVSLACHRCGQPVWTIEILPTVEKP